MPLDTLGSSLGEGEESVCFWVGFAWLGMYINYMLLHIYVYLTYVYRIYLNFVKVLSLLYVYFFLFLNFVKVLSLLYVYFFLFSFSAGRRHEQLALFDANLYPGILRCFLVTCKGATAGHVMKHGLV